MKNKQELLDIKIPELGTKCSYNCGSDRYGVEIIKHDGEEYPIIYRKKYRIRVIDYRDRENIFEWHPKFKKWCRISDSDNIGVKNRIIFHGSSRTPLSVINFDKIETKLDPGF